MKVQYQALDGLRGIAALAVVIYHYGAWEGLKWLAPHGYLAVDFFFCLSGFIVAHAYEGKIRSEAMSFGEFVRVRLIRLYPTVAISFLLAAGVAMTGAASEGWEGVGRLLGDLGLSLLLIPRFIDGAGPSKLLFPLNVVIWSLFFELVANIVWAAGVRWLTSFRIVLLLVASGLVFAVLIGLDGSADFGSSAGGGFWAGFFRVGYSFTAGLL